MTINKSRKDRIIELIHEIREHEHSLELALFTVDVALERLSAEDFGEVLNSVDVFANSSLGKLKG
jgi:hypothetical protein